jgi:hypothetical protein
MSKANGWENGLLLLLFNNTAYTLVGDAAGLPASTGAGNLYVSLHTADPGETGDQTTSEIAYTNYARVAVARSGAGWTVTNNAVVPAAEIAFPASAGGAGGTVTHFGVGTSTLATGAGKLLYKGAVTPNIVVSSGVTPKLTVATQITED